MNSEQRTVGLLAACQAMLLSNNTTVIALNGLAGLALSPVRSLATLPLTCWVVGAAIATMPASLLMKRIGRTRGFATGTAIGVLGALLCAAALWLHNFWLLCAGSLVFGAFNGFGQYYRFAAADVASPGYRSTAISLVLAGGLAGGVIGPGLSSFSVDLLEPRFLGAYLALLLYAAITFGLLRHLRIPPPTEVERSAKGRPLRVIAAQPKFVVAVLGSAIGYAVMNFVMTATPIAMDLHGHSYDATMFVISSHVIGMFAPSFFTGGLIRRFGVLAIMFAGALLNLAAVLIALAGIALANFWWGLVLVGVGWNFLFIGGTTLLIETCRPEERAKVQGANDLTVFGMMTLSSLSSGMIVTQAGWERVNLSALPLVALAGVTIAWFAWRERSRRQPSAGV